jgi:hypothetical protein
MNHCVTITVKLVCCSSSFGRCTQICYCWLLGVWREWWRYLQIPTSAELWEKKRGKPFPGTETSMPYVIGTNEAFPFRRYLLSPNPGSEVSGDETKENVSWRLSRPDTLGIPSDLKTSLATEIWTRTCRPNYSDYVYFTQFYHRTKYVFLLTDRSETLGLINLPRQGGSVRSEASEMSDSSKIFFFFSTSTHSKENKKCFMQNWMCLCSETFRRNTRGLFM